MPENISHVNLRTLIDAGIPIDLPEDHRLLLGVIKKGSDYIGKQALSCFPPEQDGQIDLVGIFRGVKLLFPEPGLRIRADDRLLLIATPDAWEQKKRHFYE